ncbi:hypothetical protein [Halomicrococcus sp. NG-SE-24]|uniref:hypothetical protein n=1 Tax=Halomicrococcus sp. NG-SE-24 TaxID=3436928 RepID=UPI003D985F61
MPICPGCHSEVPYERLAPHVRGCLWIWNEQPNAGGSTDLQFARRLEEIEVRLDELESERR